MFRTRVIASTLALLALVAASAASAQTITNVVVGKNVELVQLDGVPPLIPDPTPPSPTYGGPFGFEASVWGDDLDLLSFTPTIVSVPPGSGIVTLNGGFNYNGGVLGYNGDDGHWNFGAPNFTNWGSPNGATRDTLFRNGTYVFDVGGAIVPLNLTPPTTPPGPGPFFTLTGGSWAGGVYVIDVHNALGIMTSPFTGYAGNADAAISWGLGGDDGPVAGGTWFRNASPGAADFISFSLPPLSLQSGQEYSLGALYAAIVDENSVPGLPGSLNLAYIATNTSVIIQAVGDVTPPVINGLTVSKMVLSPPNHKMVGVTVTADATDDVGVTSLKIVSVTSNEPDNGTGDGDKPNDISITGDLSVDLRAERSGHGSGRVYTITVEARDAAGNTATDTVTVVVPKSGSDHDERNCRDKNHHHGKGNDRDKDKGKGRGGRDDDHGHGAKVRHGWRAPWARH